jgi:hypothetical protein
MKKIGNSLYPSPRNIRTAVRNFWHKVNLHEAVCILKLPTSTIELFVLLLTCVYLALLDFVLEHIGRKIRLNY